jgi:hypothetical protein
MPNCAHEANRLKAEIVQCTGLVKTVCIDSKADDQPLYELLKRQHRMQRLTIPRKGMDQPPARQKMIREMQTPPHRKTYKQRATTVEPMQGLVKALFDGETCWMRGDASHRWRFAAMGVAVQMTQRRAYRHGTSTWNITEAVLGV